MKKISTAANIAIFLILLFFVGYMLVEPIRQVVYGEATITDVDMFFGTYPVSKWVQVILALILILVIVWFGKAKLLR